MEHITVCSMFHVPCFMSGVLGHQKNLEFLRDSIQKGKIAHAYLFWGEAQLGKKRVAMEFAKMILCEDSSGALPCQNCKVCRDIENNIYPDVNLIEPEQSGIITIQKIRALRDVLSFTPFNGKYKLAIIDSAEAMNQEAGNAFLKTIEEPSGNTVIVLISSAPNFLPETILSRVQQIRFSRVDAGLLMNFLAGTGMNRVEAGDLVRISQNKPGKIFNFLNDGNAVSNFKKEVEELFNLATPKYYFQRFAYLEKRKGDGDPKHFLEIYLRIFRDILLVKAGDGESLVLNFKKKEMVELARRLSFSDILKTLKLIQRIHFLSRTTNLNLKLALEFLMLNFATKEQ